MKNSTKVFVFVALPALLLAIAAILIIFNAFGADVKSKDRDSDDKQDIEQLIEDLKKYAKDRLDIEEIQENIDQVKADLSNKIDVMIGDKVNYSYISELTNSEGDTFATQDYVTSEIDAKVNYSYISELTNSDDDKFATQEYVTSAIDEIGTGLEDQDVQRIINREVTHAYVKTLRDNDADDVALTEFATLAEINEGVTQFDTENIVEDGESFDYFIDN